MESTFSAEASSQVQVTVKTEMPAHKRQCSSISEADFNLILNNKKSFQQL